MKKNRLMIRSIILAIMIAAIGYTFYTSFFAPKERVTVGDEAPDFVLTDLNGKTHKLSDYRGKGVFLNFWGTWCKPCEQEMPDMSELYPEFKAKGVEILAVNVNEQKLNVENFVNRYGLKFPVVIDQGDQLRIAYGVDPLPTTFLVDKDGKITNVITGTMSHDMIKQHLTSIMP